MSIITHYQNDASVCDLTRWVNFPRSCYYYKPGKNRRGILPSTTTGKQDGTQVSNLQVVEEIKKIVSAEFVCYGYQNVREALKKCGFIINHKKVYRLMNENQLLLGKMIRTNGKRKWVKFRKITSTYPMEYLCWDIKYIWVKSERKNYYLLSLMDVYSRRILEWIFQGSIRKADVLKMIGRVENIHGLKGVTIRNDNGSQFIANQVRNYLQKLEANQEFTHIATPQENSYIEAFHSILDREVVQRFEFESYYEAKLTIEAYMNFYNNKRQHGSLSRKTPMDIWNEYYESFPIDMHKEAKVSQDLSRVEAPAGTCLALDKSGDTAIFAYQSVNDDDNITLNSF